MKKLIISIVATASLALVAKADVFNSTSFEGLDLGAITADNKDAFLKENDYIYWTGYSADSDLAVKALGGEGGLRAKPEGLARPLTGDDAKALAIDVDTPLARNIATEKGEGVPQNIGTGLYFDSMVQFTATEDAPEPTPGDKLIVWLKEIPGEGKSATPTYKLCVTAAELNEEAEPTAKVFETSAQIEPETWNRLSIAAKVVKVGESNITEFKVYVNSTLLETGAPLYSLVPYTTEADDNGYYNRITSVSFQGKGAIDDLVWTTEDPIADSYMVIVKDDVLAAVSKFKYMIGNEKSADIPLVYSSNEDVTGEAEISVPAGTKTLTVILELTDGFALQGGTKTEDGWVKPFTLVKDEPLELVVIEAVSVAQIGNVTYTSLTDALAAAQAGETIELLANIETDAAFVVTKKTVAIDLNGMTVSATKNDTEGNGVFWVQQGGELTINDTAGGGKVNGVGGNRWNIAVFADGGTVIINGGTYTNVGAQGSDMTHFDLIYAKNGGRVEINGGTFICATPKWTLNSHDSLTGTFEVKGGMFKGYDPSNMETENGLTSWCPAGYEAKQDASGYYVVTKKTTTVKPGASVEVDSEAAANAVEIEVVVPAGVEITAEAYKAYFKKIVTNETGKYVVTVVLDEDKVTPEIEATTDDEGNVVTPAISFGPKGEVTINISNQLPGLFYGIKYATTVGGVETATAIPGLTVTPKAGGTAGFFRVVVDFKEIPTPVAE